MDNKLVANRGYVNVCSEYLPFVKNLMKKLPFIRQIFKVFPKFKYLTNFCDLSMLDIKMTAY